MSLLKNKCKRCGRSITWAMLKVQWKRWLKAGYEKEVAFEQMSLCQKCNTKQMQGATT